MEKPTASRQQKTRRVSWVDSIFLFGCFLALCTLFSVVVTLGVALQEHLQAGWPETTATIRTCSVERVGSRSTANVIDCRISYLSDGEPVVSTVRSTSSTAPERIIWEHPAGRAQQVFDAMLDWVNAHPRGSTLSVHYDPSNPRKAALVMTDMPLGGPQTEKNVRFTVDLAAVTAAFLAIGAFARSRARRSTAQA